MKRILLSILIVAAALMTACGGQTTTTSDSARDTVQVPEGITGEDSVVYVENAVLQSPFSVNDLLSLAEVHAVEERLFNYENEELAEDNPEFAQQLTVTPQDSAALRLANRLMRMSEIVKSEGNANDRLQWASAVNAAIDTFCKAVPSVSSAEALDDIIRVMDKFSSQTQHEMNYQSYVYATIDYYHTIEAYRQWISAVPTAIKPLAQKEYEAWYDLNEARFALWNDVSYTREWYSMKPLEIEGYYANLADNRRAELDVERAIVLDGKPYQQQGETVTTRQWETWITEHSVPQDYEECDEAYMPSDSLVAERVQALRTTFSRWLGTRQAFATALPEEQSKSYDNLTADIHSRFIGTLPSLIPYGEE